MGFVNGPGIRLSAIRLTENITIQDKESHMSSEKIEFNAGLTISRVSGPDGHYAQITVDDRDAVRGMIKIEMSMKSLALAITGQGCIEGKGTARNIERVGTIMENKDFTFFIGGDDYGNAQKARAIEEAQRICPAGWTPDLSFSSQNSFFKRDGKQFARTIIRRWVDKENQDA
jgi:hypothetical protein